MENQACPSETQLAEFLAGTCSTAEETVIRAHLGNCSRCDSWLADARANDALFTQFPGRTQRGHSYARP